MHTYLRNTLGFRAAENDVRLALQQLDPEGTAKRHPKARKVPKAEYIVPGPNYLWSLDGHDKFRNYGIEIYGAIDAYSRRIIWLYVGNSNRTKISVVKQYLEAVV
jgi:hypothetical protein